MTLEYNPNSTEILAGSAAGSNHHLLMYHDDANLFDLSEAAATPGFDLTLDFDSFRVDSDYANHFKIEIKCWYKGGPAHKKKIYIYNWITELWEPFTSRYDDIPKTSGEVTYTYYKEFGVGLQEAYNGRVRIRITHESEGTATHKFYINHLKLSGVIIGIDTGPHQYTDIGDETDTEYTTTTTTTT